MKHENPPYEECLSLLKELKCNQRIIDHSHQVAYKALVISKNFEVDLTLIRAGALLHDIGRSKSKGVEHALIGAQILKDKGYPQKLINIVERHVGAGITQEEAAKLGLPRKDYIPVTLEEKIVSHADNLLNESQQVDIDFVIRKLESQLGLEHPSILRLKKLHQELIIIPKSSDKI